MIKIEYYLPDKIITNKDIGKKFPDWNDQLFEKKVGIQQRHVSSNNETALDLAYQAAVKCLESFDKSSIDFILLCTQSPDYFLPTSACVLQHKLDLNNSCGALDYNLGCSGYVYGLSLAKGLLAGGIASNILLIMAETYSKRIHPKDRTNISIFGDGAAATVISQSNLGKIGEFVLNTNGEGYDKLIVKNGACRNKFSVDAPELTYGEGNIYDDNHLYMNGPDIFNFTIENVPLLIEKTLKKNNLTLDEVDYFVFHQANAYMLNLLRKMIKIPKEKFFIDMSDTGNTVSATIPIALKKALIRGNIKTGDKVLLAGFGVGLSWGATIVEL